MIAPWRVTLLGGLRLERDGQTVTRFRSQKTSALFALLCLHAGRTWGREELCETFWPTDGEDPRATPEAGRNSLRVALASLRKTLEPPPCPSGAVLETTATHVRLRPEAVRTDIAQFEAALKTGNLARARQLYTGPFLPGIYDSWAVQEAERLDALFQRIGDDFASADDASMPLTGVRQAAPLAPVTPENLPLPLGRFFGRDEETARLEMLLLDPTAPLVTIVGAGGTGKTRFMVETAHLLLREKPRQAARFPGGIWFVPLAPVRQSAQIPALLRDMLGIAPSPGEDALTQIDRHLAGRSALILLDNLEQIGAADLTALLSDLTRQLPQVMWLATSRRRTGLRGERILRLGTLPLPDPSDTLDEMAQNPALGLFVDRAREADVDFALTPRNAPDVRSVCVLLDGVPLAIELAAAWANVFSVGQMVESLRERVGRFTARSEGERTERHRSLYDAARWSCDLLPDATRQLFARLSVFSGGFTLSAAREVCALPDAPDGLARLLEQSLIIPAPSDGPHGGRRFTVLEPLREFAGELLAGEQAAFEERHADWITAQTEAWGQAANWTMIEGDINNVRAALRRALATPSEDAAATERAMRLAVATWQFWWNRGLWDEAVAALDAAIARDSDHIAAPVRIGLLRARGAFHFYRNQYDEAEACWDRQLGIALAAGEILAAARTRVNLALVASARSHFEQACQQCEDAIALYESVGADKASRAAAYNNLGTNRFLLDDLNRSEAAFRAALSLFEDMGEAGKQGRVPAITGIGCVQERQGDYNGAYACFAEAVALSREEGTTMRLADSLLHLVTVCGHIGTPEAIAEAHRHLREAVPLRRSLQNYEGIGRTLEAAAALLQRHGDRENAARLWGAYDALYRLHPSLHQTPQQARIRADGCAGLCDALGKLAFTAAYESGSQWDTSMALDFIEQTI